MGSILILMMTLVVASGAPASAACAPTEEMKQIAAKMSPPLHLPKDDDWTAWRGEGADASRWHTVCPDVNDDGARDLCTILVGENRRWLAGCFVSRKGALQEFDSFADSESSQSSRVEPSYYAIGTVRKGETLEWSDGIAEIKLKRDCVSFGGSESSMSVYCFNGSYFLEVQLAD